MPPVPSAPAAPQPQPMKLATHVALPLVFSDHMVLQRNTAAPVWGTADPSSGSVTVSIAGKNATASVDASGNWRAVLSALPVGGPYTLMVSGADTLTVNDVLVGDVYLTSGQSNMTYAMLNDATNSAAAAAANDPNLRLFGVYANPVSTPQTDVHDHSTWAAATPAAVHFWSAVSYYYGEELRQKTGVPIGILESAVGETTGECWASAQAVDAHPDILASAQWQMNWAQSGGHPAINYTPGACFNGMINPLVGYGIAGALWYQGEGNTWPQGHEKQYGALLTLLAQDWRSRWGSAFPFYVVQLPNYSATSTDPNAWSGEAGVREGQLQASSMLSNSGLAVAIDLGDGQVHPPDKADVAHRLALLTEHDLYHDGNVDQGPTLEGYSVNGSSIVLRFTHADGGLVARGGSLNQFAIAGADKSFVWASATIVGDTVFVSSPSVAVPVAVRYAWSDNPSSANLYNGTGLPASPFRTDTW